LFIVFDYGEGVSRVLLVWGRLYVLACTLLHNALCTVANFGRTFYPADVIQALILYERPCWYFNENIFVHCVERIHIHFYSATA